MGKWVLALALVLALVAVAAGPAAAQDTIALYFADPVNGLQRFGETSGAQFDIVALMKATRASKYAEFVMDELTLLVPGVFRVATTKVTNSSMDEGDNTLGEYAIEFRECTEAGEVEVVRVSYIDLSNLIPFEFILEIRAFGAGDSRPSGFGGQMGYLGCGGADRPLMGEAWPELAPCSLPDGACGLNLWYCTPTAAENFTALKTRY